MGNPGFPVAPDSGPDGSLPIFWNLCEFKLLPEELPVPGRLARSLRLGVLGAKAPGFEAPIGFARIGGRKSRTVPGFSRRGHPSDVC